MYIYIVVKGYSWDYAYDGVPIKGNVLNISEIQKGSNVYRFVWNLRM